MEKRPHQHEPGGEPWRGSLSAQGAYVDRETGTTAIMLPTKSGNKKYRGYYSRRRDGTGSCPCLECGVRLKSLAKHLACVHSLSVADYRERHGPTAAVTAAEYYAVAWGPEGVFLHAKAAVAHRTERHRRRIVKCAGCGNMFVRPKNRHAANGGRKFTTTCSLRCRSIAFPRHDKGRRVTERSGSPMVTQKVLSALDVLGHGTSEEIARHAGILSRQVTHMAARLANEGAVQRVKLPGRRPFWARNGFVASGAEYRSPMADNVRAILATGPRKAAEIVAALGLRRTQLRGVRVQAGVLTRHRGAAAVWRLADA